MARREDLMEALDAIETGMRRIKESRGIWQNELVYALCQGVRLFLMEELKHGRQETHVGEVSTNDEMPL